jgi:hypothetical protein
MLTRSRIAGGLVLVLGAAALAGFAVSTGFGFYISQSNNPDNTFTSAPSFTNTGYLSPSAQAADSGGDNNGFELNPTYAYSDDSLYASNIDGPGDLHLYYDYGISLPSGSTIEGIRARVDWWLDGAGGDNSLGVELSWNGGASWTTALKIDATETTSEHTAILGGVADTWGRLWTVDELSNANFRLHVSCNCSGGAECDSRDYFLDWVAVNVFYTAP